MINHVKSFVIPLALIPCVSLATTENKIFPVSESKSDQGRPNILFIISDDLRPQMGCYGYPAAITPNIDHLAASGVQFTHAYCQAALSGPSRGSLFSGLRPSASGYIHNDIRFRTAMPNVVTLPEFFGRNGYATIALGKIYHEGDKKQMAGTFNADAAMPEFPRAADSDYKDPHNVKLLNAHRREMIEKYGPSGTGGLTLGPVCEFFDAPEEEYHDAYITTSAIETFKQMAAENKPFFMGVGYKKPHLSFIAPKKYWDMYEGSEIPLTADSIPPLGAPSFTLHDSYELRTRYGVPKYGRFSDEYQRYLMRGYLACVSFVDAQIGRLMEGLQEAGLADNTIVVFCGDHGWHLGEMGVWGKATNYEIANRVPMIIIDPRTGKKGKTDAIAELLDIYPTLADLTGLAIPHTMQKLEGHSLRSVLENPSKKSNTIAVSEFPCPALREWAGVKTADNVRKEYFDHSLNDIEMRIRIENPDTPLNVFQNNVIGYTIRDNRYRCVMWVDQSQPGWKIIASELYDQTKDPNETINLATDSKQKNIVNKLTKKMWKILRFEQKFKRT
ncbi:MAG: sulfatase [Porphyromonadaceae bacterium]|nr:sulfatase [Porphyromonadaceae bacterium]